MSYELVGPLSPQARKATEESVVVHSVRLQAERNPGSNLNPIGILRRVVTNSSMVQDAILVVGVQEFEVFTVVREQSNGQQQPGIRKRLRQSAITHIKSAASHVPHRKSTEASEVQDDRLPDEHDLAPDGILQDHTYSCGVAFAQVLKITSQDRSVTVFYHPNTMKAAKLSHNLTASAMRFTFCLETVEETTAILHELENRMDRYCQAALFLGQQFVLPSLLHVIAVTTPLPDPGSTWSEESPELIIKKDVAWGTTITAPASWGEEAADGAEPIWVFLNTPIGYGKTDISPAVVSLYKKGDSASFYVGVRHPQLQSTTRGASRLRVKPATGDMEAEAVADSSDDEAEDAWQPADSDDSTDTIEQVGRTPSISERTPSISEVQLPTTRLDRASRGVRRSIAGVLNRRSMAGPNGSSVSSASRSPSLPGSGSHSDWRAGRPPSGHGVGDKHVRLHCHAIWDPSGGAQGYAKALPSDGGSLQTVPTWLNPSSPEGRQTAAVVAVVAVLALWLLPTWGTLMTLLNAGLLAWHFLSPALGSSMAISRMQQGKAASGCWKVTLIKAEIVTNEPWSAAGDSVVGAVTQASETVSSEDRKRRLAEEYSTIPDVIDRFFLAFKGDQAMAQQKLKSTYDWRVANGCIDILSQPQPHYAFFKKMFRHGILGLTTTGHPIWFMKVGDMKEGYKTYKASGLTDRDLARHVAFVMDYMYTAVESRSLPDGRALWLLDLRGMGMTDVGSAAFDMGKQIAMMISQHWPERLYRSFIVNIPGFFSLVWKLAEPLLAPQTRKKIRLLRGKQDILTTLTEEINMEDIPAEYGGNFQGGVYDSKIERDLQALVDKLNKQDA